MDKEIVHPKNLSDWLMKNIDENELIFDRCSYMFEIIVQKLNENNLDIAVENRILMIKLCKFLYENSYK